MKLYKTLFTFLFVISTIISLAETSPVDSLDFSKSGLETEIDSLISLWYNKQMLPGGDTAVMVEEQVDSTYVPMFSDSVYKDRLDRLPVVIDMSYNKIVRNYIHMYSQRKRDLVEKIMGLSEYYFPIFEQILDANNMPLELKYLPVIESALNPNAVSKAGATGMWQFMYYTGKMYKLEINSFVDERRDPIKSSYAAVEFLKDLYDIYGDWTLVIAAYNCGPGNVNKAIRRSGGKRDYWDIYYRLPKETRGYVPAFIAATYVLNYTEEHNLSANKNTLPILCDTIITNNRIHLEQISKVMDMPLAEIRSLNPQYRRDIIPGKGKSYALRLPFEETTRFIDLQDSIVAYNDSIYFNPETLSKAPQYTTFNSGPPSKNHTKLVYVIKSGDNLGFIAEWYSVSVSNLKYWNNIRGSRIRAGQKLVIYVHKSKVSKYEKINTMTFAQKQATLGKNVVEKTNEPVIPLKSGEYEFYTVKRGDTLWDIAKLFPGVSDTEIMQWNGITNASKISVGQKLKIKITG
jgi:membrane-bound lytic murein transglycosylase D